MAIYKDQVAKLNEWGANSNTTKILGALSSTNNAGNFGTIMDMIITGLNSVRSLLKSASATGAVLPSATAATYGTAFVTLPNNVTSTAQGASGFQSVATFDITPSQINFVTLNTATETVTFQVTVTYNDGTTVAVATKTLTGNGTATYVLADLSTIFVNGKYIVEIDCALKSSIANSTVTCTVTVLGHSQLANIQIPALN